MARYKLFIDLMMIDKQEQLPNALKEVRNHNVQLGWLHSANFFIADIYKNVFVLKTRKIFSSRTPPRRRLSSTTQLRPCH